MTGLQTVPATNSLERALAVLDVVSHTSSGMTLSDVMRRLRLPASSCHYILTRLEQHGYLTRNPETKRYEIGVRLIAVAHGALRKMGLRKLADPVLHRLAAETRLGAFVGVLERNAVMIVGKSEPPGLLTMDMEIGVRYPAHRTALGKAILAHHSSRDLLAFFAGSGVARRTKRNALIAAFLQQLKDARHRGYATNDEELFIGFRAVAAPIMSADGRIVAAVSATGPRFRVDDFAIIGSVTCAARDISKRLADGR